MVSTGQALWLKHIITKTIHMLQRVIISRRRFSGLDYVLGDGVWERMGTMWGMWRGGWVGVVMVTLFLFIPGTPLIGCKANLS